jgi:carboxymethylenebutenolidase
MGQRVEFAADGHSGEGHLAVPASGTGQAIVVVQEWWGIDAHMRSVVERFAEAGFVTIAPDLYHGTTASSPDEAGRLLMELDVDRAEREIAAAAAFALARPECTSKTFGIVGFCMGGALAQYTATKNERTGAAVSFYGGFKKVTPDWERLRAPLLLIYAGKDRGVPADSGHELAKRLRAAGRDVEVVVYPEADHAFFNDTKPRFDAAAAADAWRRTVEHFRRHVR